MEGLTQRTLAFIRRHGLLEPGQGVLVALSGGADSVALALILHELSASGALPLRLTLAHLNHGLRGADADADEEFCRHLAAELGLPIVASRADVKGDRRRGESLEEAARRVRYRFLTQAAQAERCAAVAVGHQADDVAETVLMRLLRGCGLRGLGAMAPARASAAPDVRIVRPLLETGSDELCAMLQRRRQPWREDKSNRDRRFLRNRVRHDLLPGLATQRASLCAMNSSACALNEAMDRVLDAHWDALCVAASADAVELDAERYAELAPALRKLAVRRAVSALLREDEQPSLTREHYDEARDLAAAGVGAAVSLPGGLVAAREHGIICIVRPGGAVETLEVELAVPGRAAVPWAGVEIAAELLPLPADGHGSLLHRARPAEVFLSAGEVAMPLTVRTRKPGDRFRPLGAPGVRKLKDYFIDRKVPRRRRDRVPVVTDARGRIVWVLGHDIADPFKLTGSERTVLHLTAHELP